MPLSPAQLSTLKTNITANTATVTYAGSPTQIKDVPNNGDGNAAVAAWYNLAASPSFTLWKKLVPITTVGEKFDAGELAGLTSLNTQRLQCLAAWLAMGVNPSLAGVRQFFDDVFSGAGGANTRAALLALWKRLATNFEKLFATGTGSDAVPAISAFADGTTLSAADVLNAMNAA